MEKTWNSGESAQEQSQTYSKSGSMMGQKWHIWESSKDKTSEDQKEHQGSSHICQKLIGLQKIGREIVGPFDDRNQFVKNWKWCKE